MITVISVDKDSDKLIELYKMAMDEYRFEVKLSWDAIRFFTTLNVGILGFGSSILGLEQVSPKWITVPIFVIGIVLSILGIATRMQYRKYYLNTIAIKTRIENKLDLKDLTISPTEEVDQPTESLVNRKDWIKKHMLPIKTVTSYQIAVLIIFVIIYVGMIWWILDIGHHLFFK